MDMSVAHGHRLREEHGTEQFLEIASGHEQGREERFRDSNPARDLTRKSLAHVSARDLDACLRDKAKLQRAYGGCLGNQKR